MSGDGFKIYKEVFDHNSEPTEEGEKEDASSTYI